MESLDKIAIIGTGLMGRPMAEKITQSGYPLSVYNRTIEKAAPLKEYGAKVSQTPVEAILDSNCLVLMLSDYEAIKQVLFDPEVIQAIAARTIIQMGTISPEESLNLSDEIVKNGGDYFEVTVLGSVPEAREGQLIMMAGASTEQFERWSKFLKCFGPEPIHIGKVGQASALKLAMNQLIATLTSAFSLSLAFVMKSGISSELFMDILRKSALYAPTFDKKLDRMLEQNFSNPNFPTKHLLKDIELFIKESCSLNLDTTALQGIRDIFEKAMHQDHSQDDYSSIYNIIYPDTNN